LKNKIIIWHLRGQTVLPPFFLPVGESLVALSKLENATTGTGTGRPPRLFHLAKA